MLFWLCVAVLASEPNDITEDVGSAVVNWSTSTVEITRAWSGTGVDASRKTTEHEARRHLGEGLRSGVGSVRVTTLDDVSTLSQVPDLGSRIEQRATRWSVREARYFASGRVELVGELSLVELLAPWTLSRSVEAQDSPDVSTYTGVVIDARGTGVVPAFAPQVLSPGGKVLWDGSLTRSASTKVSPVVYVPDPSHPAAARAGDQPMMVRAGSATGADVHLDDDSTARFRAGLRNGDLVRSGTVVVVVDP